MFRFIGGSENYLQAQKKHQEAIQSGKRRIRQPLLLNKSEHNAGLPYMDRTYIVYMYGHLQKLSTFKLQCVYYKLNELVHITSFRQAIATFSISLGTATNFLIHKELFNEL